MSDISEATEIALEVIVHIDRIKLITASGEIIRRDEDKKFRVIKVLNGMGHINVGDEKFREAMKILSSWFSVVSQDDKFYVKGLIDT